MKQFIKIFLASVLLLIFPVSAASANTAPTTLEYIPGTTDTILTSPQYITDIQLEAGEEYTAIILGDSARWDIQKFKDVQNSQWHIYVQPIQKYIESNMLIITNHRTYNIHLSSGEFHNSIINWKY